MNVCLKASVDSIAWDWNLALHVCASFSVPTPLCRNSTLSNAQGVVFLHRYIGITQLNHYATGFLLCRKLGALDCSGSKAVIAASESHYKLAAIPIDMRVHAEAYLIRPSERTEKTSLAAKRVG